MYFFKMSGQNILTFLLNSFQKLMLSNTMILLL